MSSLRHSKSILFGVTFVLIMSMAIGLISASAQSSSLDTPLVGVVMKGGVTDQKQVRNDTSLPPANYFEESFKLLKDAGINHARFLLYWEAYEKNPQAFMNELEQVANLADKYGIKVIYDNHQWHTSSWLEKRGTGFPASLFQNNSKYVKGGGGNTPDPAARTFW